jgi:hypothetical protein
LNSIVKYWPRSTSIRSPTPLKSFQLWRGARNGKGYLRCSGPGAVREGVCHGGSGRVD